MTGPLPLRSLIAMVVGDRPLYAIDVSIDCVGTNLINKDQLDALVRRVRISVGRCVDIGKINELLLGNSSRYRARVTGTVSSTNVNRVSCR